MPTETYIRNGTRAFSTALVALQQLDDLVTRVGEFATENEQVILHNFSGKLLYEFPNGPVQGRLFLTGTNGTFTNSTLSSVPAGTKLETLFDTAFTDDYFLIDLGEFQSLQGNPSVLTKKFNWNCPKELRDKIQNQVGQDSREFTICGVFQAVGADTLGTANMAESFTYRYSLKNKSSKDLFI